MAIAKGKKRFYLTLTESRMDELKVILREFNAPRGFESAIVDDYLDGFIRHITPAMRRMKATGKTPTLVDFFALVGSVMQEAQDEENQGKLL